MKLACVCLTLLTLSAWGATKDFVILQHPMDQVVRKGGEVTFRALAERVRGSDGAEPSYQWQKCSDPEEDSNAGPGHLKGQWINVGADSPELTLTSLGEAAVGYYRVVVGSPDVRLDWKKGVPSLPASLMLFVRINPLTLYGTPVLSSGSSSTACAANNYVRYVVYKKAGTNFGWALNPAVSPRKATDLIVGSTTPTTHVKYVGNKLDRLCGPKEVTVGNLQYNSTLFQFTIYFMSTTPPASPYSLQLEGFLE